MRKILMSMFTLIFSVVIFMTNVDAADGGFIGLDTDIGNSQQIMYGGQSVTITLKLDKYPELAKGINAYQATLDYDSTIFEEVKEKDFLLANGWIKFKYNHKTREFVTIKKSGSKDSEDILKITLRIRGDVQSRSGKTVIKIKNIAVSEGIEDLYVPERSVTIKIPKTLQDTPNVSPAPSPSTPTVSSRPNQPSTSTRPTTSNSNTLKSDTSVSTNYSQSKNPVISDDVNLIETETDELLSETVDSEVNGIIDDDVDISLDDKDQERLEIEEKVEEELFKYKRKYIGYCFLFVLTLIVLLLIIWFYRKRKEEDQDTESRKIKIIVLAFLMGAISLLTLGITADVVSALIVRGEITNDGITDYSDIDLLSSHLIHLQTIQNEYLENADMNIDGRISITDLSLLVQKVEKSLNYTVNMSNVSLSKTKVNKNEKIILSFFADVNYDSIVKGIVVNGKVYNVELIEGSSNQYRVEVNTGSVAGNINFTITEIILDNNQKVVIDYQRKIEVLGDKPVVSNMVQEDNFDDTSITLGFDINDVDNTFINGKLIITNQEDKIIYEKDIKVGSNHITTPVFANQQYNYVIQVTYNRDCNKNDNKTLIENEVIKTGLVQLIKDYKLQVNNIETYEESGITKYFDKNEDIYIKFNSLNRSMFVPEKVVIDGKLYNLVSDGNTYHTKIRASNKTGKQNLTIEKIILNNGKIFKIINNNQVTVDILKDSPIIEDFFQDDDSKNLKSNLSFNIKDSDNAFVGGKVVLKHENGKVYEKAVKVGENNIEFSLENNQKYTYAIQITYDKDSNKSDNINFVKNEVVNTGAIQLLNDYELKLNDLTIHNDKGETKYFSKGEKVVLNFKSNNISKYTPIKAVINGKEYPLIYSNGMYQAELRLGNRAGAQKITIEKLLMNNNSVIKIKNDNQVVIDVLGDKPALEDFSQEEDDNNLKTNLRFHIDDFDDTFVSGKVILKHVDGRIYEKDIKVGENNISISVENNQKYTYMLQITYDRDSDKKDNINLVKDELLKEGSIHLSSDYELEINNIKVSNNKHETKYFAKDEKVIVKFAINNNKSKLLPTTVVINGEEYSLTRTKNVYQTEISSNTKSGKQTFAIEKVILSNGKVIEITENNEFSIEVLKDKPILEDFSQEDDDSNLKSNLSFNIKDLDNAFVSGKVVLKHEDKIVFETPIKVGENDILLSVDNNKEYTYSVQMTYDGDSDKEDNINLVEDELLTTDSICLLGDYELKVDGIDAYNGEKVAKYFAKDEKVTIRFKSSNISTFNPVKAVINGKEYFLTEIDDRYQAEIETDMEAGEKEIILEKIILSNQKVLEVSANNKVVIDVLKEKPVLEDFSQEDDETNLKTNLKFKIKDLDDAFIEGKVILKHENGKTFEKSIEIGENNIEFSVDNNQKYTYIIQIAYDRDSDKKDSVNFVEETLKDGSIHLLGNYELKVSDLAVSNKSGETKYFSKDEKITIKFKSSNISSFNPTRAVINGKEYSLTQVKDTYQAQINSSTKSGEETFVIEKIILSNGKVIPITENNEILIDVLKDKPVLEDFSQKDDDSNLKSTLSFNIKDSDNAFVSGKVVLKHENEFVFEAPIKVGENNILLSVDNNKEYTYSVQMTYDEDSNQEDGINLIEDVLLKTGSIYLLRDYELKVSNLTVSNKKNETRYFAKNEKITVKFESSNISSFNPTKAVINGKEYTLTQVDGVYRAEMNASTESGEQRIVLEKIILSNQKELEISTDNEIVIDILREKPTLENFSQKDDEVNLKSNLKFKIKDSDDAFVSGKVILKHEDGSVQEKPIKVGENNILLSVDNNKEYTYSVQVTYDEDSDKEDNINLVEDVLLKTGSINLLGDYELKVSDLTVSNKRGETKYFAKGEKIIVKFESSNISSFNPTKAVINGKEYTLTQVDGVYRAEMNASTESGEQRIVLEKIILSNQKELEVSTDNEIVISVLKAKPVLENFAQSDNIEKLQINLKFNLKDLDNAFVSGKVILKHENGSVKEQPIKVGDNNIIFTIDNAKSYTYLVQVTYDLGFDEENQINLVEDETLKTGSINLISDYDLKISNLQANNKKGKTKYFTKGEKVFIQFESSNASRFTPIRAVINGEEYNLIRSKELYQAEIIASTKSGEQEIVIEAITLSNGKLLQISDHNKILIDVLKDKPVLENFSQNDDIANSNIILNFDIKDLDDAFIEGKVVLKEKDKIISSKKIKVGNNNISFLVDEGKSYDYSVQVTYDRDSNKVDQDNLFKNEVMRETPVQLIADYNLKIDNLTANKGLEEATYFNKGEEITVRFTSTNASQFIPEKVVIDGEEYALQNLDGKYQTVVLANKEWGIQNIFIEKIILSNERVFEVTENNDVKIEILKDHPKIEDFTYEERDNKLIVAFNLSDTDNALMNGSITVINENDEEIKTQLLIRGRNTFIFDKKIDESYNIKVISAYDLDSNRLGSGSNEYHNKVLLNEKLDDTNRIIVAEDILGIDLYQQESNSMEKIYDINISDLDNLDNYIVKVNMKNLSSFYTTIKKYKIEKDRLMFVLDYNNFVSYNSKKKSNYLEVEFGVIKNNTASNIDLFRLIELINENPQGSYIVTRDIDASSYIENRAVIMKEFCGKIDFDGHKIINLSKPLFASLHEAVIENLVVEDASLSGSNSKGLIANKVKNTIIKNVHIDGLNYITGANYSGGLVGSADTLRLEQCSLKNLTMKTSHTNIGGLVGSMSGGIIKDCYVEASISSKQEKNNNNVVAGILGLGETRAQNMIQNCIVKIHFTNRGNEKFHGGILGFSSNANTVLMNNASLSTGYGFYAIHGSFINSTSINNYQLQESTLVSNVDNVKTRLVAQNGVNKHFFKMLLRFDEEIWDLSNRSYNTLPTLKNLSVEKM